MNKPYKFDETQAYGEFKPLPAGGYVCKIMGVEETVSKNGKDMLNISLDIAEGEFAGRFAEMYRTDTRPKEEKKWGCIAYQLVFDPTDGRSTNRGFKTFCTAAEESNAGFAITWGDRFASCFKGKYIGVIFRREEYLGNDNKPHWSTKPISFRSVETIRKGVEVPEDKPLPQNNAAQTYSGYPANGGMNVNINAADDPFMTPAQPQTIAQQKQTAPVTRNPSAVTNAPTAVDLSDFEEIPVNESDLPF